MRIFVKEIRTNDTMANVLTEITRLSEKDCFYIVERHKTEFTYPLHQHKEFELNFIEHGKGVRRIVGDSVEEIGDYELVLIGGEDLEHVWEQGRCLKEMLHTLNMFLRMKVQVIWIYRVSTRACRCLNSQ